jgi:hypothetical protein
MIWKVRETNIFRGLTSFEKGLSPVLKTINHILKKQEMLLKLTGSTSLPDTAIPALSK